MSNEFLSRIKHGNSDLPPRILIAGPEGIGKSTIGSKAPSPLFICAEDGLTGLDHIQRFIPSDLNDLNAMLDAMLADAGTFKTLVIDTTDWLERLIVQSICARDGKTDVEDYGYGKGYVIMEGEMVKLLQKFDLLRSNKKLGIVMLSHVQIRTFTDPRGPSYDRFEMKGHKKMTGILREWPDACLFAVFEVHKMKVKGQQKEQAVGGDRIMHTTWSPAWDAKNRLNLPEQLPMEWDDLEAAIKENSSTSLRAKVVALHKTAKIPAGKETEAWAKAIKTLETFTADRLKVAIEKLEALQPQPAPAS